MPNNEHCTTGRPEERHDCSTVATALNLVVQLQHNYQATLGRDYVYNDRQRSRRVTVSRRNFAKTNMKSVTILDKLRLQCETLIIKVCKVKCGHSGTF
jgi:hypothetical protein